MTFEKNIVIKPGGCDTIAAPGPIVSAERSKKTGVFYSGSAISVSFGRIPIFS